MCHTRMDSVTECAVRDILTKLQMGGGGGGEKSDKLGHHRRIK